MKKIIEQYVSIWNTKGVSELKDIFTEKSKYWDAMQEGDAIQQLTASMIATHEAFSDVSFQIISLEATIQNQFYLEWQMTGVNTGEFFGAEPTGKRIAIKGLDSIKLESNRIVEIKSFYDSSLFNQQLELE